MPDASDLHDNDVLAASRHWLERAVIGLNLCPFAKGVHAKGQVRWVVSQARDTDALQQDLVSELLHLQATEAQHTDTTLLVLPHVLHDFLDFNDFLDVVDATLRALNLEGVLQVASFHPDYQFAGVAPDDVTNHSNRAPYPTLHLLRESSLDLAVAAFPEAHTIYERNIETLQRLGHEGLRAWMDGDATPG